VYTADNPRFIHGCGAADAPVVAKPVMNGLANGLANGVH
jgi:hypothetical protein